MTLTLSISRSGSMTSLLREEEIGSSSSMRTIDLLLGPKTLNYTSNQCLPKTKSELIRLETGTLMIYGVQISLICALPTLSMDA
jgi:hypothetical protein